MQASIDISYYPLRDGYKQEIISFIKRVKGYDFVLETNGFSTQIFGEFNELMEMLKKELTPALNQKKCMFVIKLAAGTLNKEDLPEELK